MILRLLSNAMPWLLAVLLGIAVFSFMYANSTTAELETAQSRVARAEDRAEALARVMKFQRDHIRKLSTTLAARERLIADDSEKITRQRNAARQLERDDDATASWADQPVPDATRRWLQQLAADAAAGGDNAGAAELPAEAAAGADEDDQQQP